MLPTMAGSSSTSIANPVRLGSSTFTPFWTFMEYCAKTRYVRSKADRKKLYTHTHTHTEAQQASVGYILQKVCPPRPC